MPGFTHDYMAKKWIGFTTDESSTMLETRSGLHLHMVMRKIYSKYCLAHCLELAVNDNLKVVIVLTISVIIF